MYVKIFRAKLHINLVNLYKRKTWRDRVHVKKCKKNSSSFIGNHINGEWTANSGVGGKL